MHKKPTISSRSNLWQNNSATKRVKVGKTAKCSESRTVHVYLANKSKQSVTVDGASRLELVCDCCLTELALVVSRTKAAVTNKVEGASPLACP